MIAMLEEEVRAALARPGRAVEAKTRDGGDGGGGFPLFAKTG